MRVAKYAEAAWDESKHPRDEAGRFVFTSNHFSGGPVSKKNTAFKGPQGSPTSFFYDMEGKEHYYKGGSQYTSAITGALSNHVGKEFHDLAKTVETEFVGGSAFTDGAELEIEAVGESMARTARLMDHAVAKATSGWSGITKEELAAIQESLEAVHTAIDEGLGEFLVAAEEAFESLDGAEGSDDEWDPVNEQLEATREKIQDSVYALQTKLDDIEDAIDDRDEIEKQAYIDFVSDGIQEMNDLVEDGVSEDKLQEHAEWWNRHLEKVENPYRIALADDGTWWYWDQDELEDWPGKDE